MVGKVGTEITLVRPGPGTALAEAIIKFGDSLRSLLGLFPLSAWDEAFADERVIAAVMQDTLVGYVLFRLPRDEIVVVHLAVASGARQRGVARMLITELASRHSMRRGIRAKCRRDYTANDVWPRLGFTALGNYPGRGSKGQLLTLWWRDHGHTDLLTWNGHQQGKLPALIDVNVFIDLHGDADSSEARMTRDLLGRVSDRLELLVAPETATEINRRDKNPERERLISTAHNQYPRLAVSPAALDDFDRELSKAVPSGTISAQTHSDVRQVATALAADIPLVITRDRDARRRLADEAFRLGQVIVTTPAEAVAITLAENDDQAYIPTALNMTDWTTHEVRPQDTAALSIFVNTSVGEQRRQLEQRIEILAAASPKSSRLLIKDAYDDHAALCGFTWSDDLLDVRLLRVLSGPLMPTLAPQLAEMIRREARNREVEKMVVSDANLDPRVRRALERDGFMQREGGLVGYTIPELLRSAELSERLRDLGNPLQGTVDSSLNTRCAANLEHEFRPCRIIDAPLPTFLVSIKPQYADDLFGYPPHLLSRPLLLGLGLEQVYYRAGSSGETAPGRILWRLSGGNHDCVFACSSLVEVRDGTPQELHRRYQRLGVWNLQQIIDAAKSHHRRALRVTDTELLPTPVSLTRLRQLAARCGHELQLQWPYRLEDGMFEAVMREARKAD